MSHFAFFSIQQQRETDHDQVDICDSGKGRVLDQLGGFRGVSCGLEPFLEVER